MTDSLAGVEMRALEYFVAVAQQGSFSAGARQSQIAQSTASAAVATLERELGVSLFQRTGRGVRLTGPGHALLPRARSILSEARIAREELAPWGEGIRATVTLGTILSTGTIDLAAVLATLRDQHPQVTVLIRLSAGPLYDHLPRLLDGSFDALLVPVPPDPPPGVLIDPIGEVRQVLACRHDDPLALVRGVTCDELRKRAFIDFPADWGNREIIDALFEASGGRRTIAAEVTDLTTALQLIAGGLGIGFLPERFATTQPSVSVVDLHDPPAAVTLGLAVVDQQPVPVAVQALRQAILASGVGSAAFPR